jgi:tetratricopeptide (TPR) repeat protein
MRIAVVVSSLAAAAAVVVVGGALLQASDGSETQAATAPTRPSGAPPLFLDLGARDDVGARELRRADRLLAQGRRDQAAAIFARDRSVDGRVGAALAAWPDGTLQALERLARERPRSALVRLHLGLVRLWAGRPGARDAWRAARRVEPDSLSAVRAGDLLFPNAPRGLPTFVPSFDPPAALQGLSPREQLERLRTDARRGDWRAKVLYGVGLQRLGRRLSAQRQFDAAVRAAPDEPEALTAAALARYDKADPARAFSRLGPLARRFPQSPTVRFHLGLALLWLGQVEEGKRQLRLARAAGPKTPLGREAAHFLARLGRS